MSDNKDNKENNEFEEMAGVAFQIITNVGTARSFYINAIKKAKISDFDGAAEQIKAGDEAFQEGHHAHADLVGKEAGGTPVNPSLLLCHAEDQLMSAETAKIYATEFIELYKKLNKQS
jgi:PTS system cellobiose-specific IIA component